MNKQIFGTLKMIGNCFNIKIRNKLITNTNALKNVIWHQQKYRIFKKLYLIYIKQITFILLILLFEKWQLSKLLMMVLKQSNRVKKCFNSNNLTKANYDG